MRWFVSLLGAAVLAAAPPALARQAPPAAMAPIPNDVRVPEPRSQARDRPAPPRPARPAPVAVAAPLAAAPALPAPPPATGPLPRAATIPAERLELYVDGAVRDAMDADRIAGVTVAVVQDGRVLLSKGYGMATADPVRPVVADRTLFRLASISKTFTWLLIAQQIEAGRYTLDTPINDLLPEAVRVPDQGFEEPIRVRHLMTHSAGFEDKALGHLFEKDPDQVRPPLQYLAEERPRRVRRPGALSVYSNYGVGLAGAIVERAGGAPFEVLLERRLLQPLGMSRTTLREPYPARDGLAAPMPAVLARDLSAGFHAAGGGYQPQPFEHVWHAGPVGGMSSTASDMARYMLALLNGGTLEGATVFGPATAAALRTPLRRNAEGVNGWAYGFNEYRLPGGLTGFGHGGDTSWFHSQLVLVPELRLGIFVSTNTTNGWRLAAALPDGIVGRFYGGERIGPRPGSPDLKRQAAVYAGSWMSTRRAYSGLEKFIMGLVDVTPVSVSAEGRLVVGGARPRQYVPAGAPGRFVEADGEDVLVFDLQNGRAVRWYAPWGGVAYDHAPFHRTPNGLALFAGLALVAALLAMVGPVLRLGREIRATGVQTTANTLLFVTAGAWLVAMLLFGAWAMSALSNPAAPLYDWPGLVAPASWLALLAALLTVGLLVLMPGVWRRSERRGSGWSVWRKLRHSAAVLTFAALAVVLLLNGALEPWSG